MQFLSDVYLRCPDCDGKRYRPEILEITIERGATQHLNVADVLNLTVSEAAMLFEHDREVIRALQPILDVGLAYLKLGQPVPTLSGGEAQRLKLAGFLAEAARSTSASRQAIAKRGVLFMFDEPTTCLLYTSDAADALLCVDLGGRRIIKNFNPNVMQGDKILLKGTSGGMIWK